MLLGIMAEAPRTYKVIYKPCGQHMLHILITRKCTASTLKLDRPNKFVARTANVLEQKLRSDLR